MLGYPPHPLDRRNTQLDMTCPGGTHPTLPLHTETSEIITSPRTYTYVVCKCVPMCNLEGRRNATECHKETIYCGVYLSPPPPPVRLKSLQSRRFLCQHFQQTKHVYNSVIFICSRFRCLLQHAAVVYHIASVYCLNSCVYTYIFVLWARASNSRSNTATVWNCKVEIVILYCHSKILQL